LNNKTIKKAISKYSEGDESIYGPIELWRTNEVTNGKDLFSILCDSGMAWSFNADISGWDMMGVTTMEAMFEYCHIFNADISQWDVANVESLTSTFDEDYFFDQAIGGWDISNNKSLQKTFQYAEFFKADLKGWDTWKVTDMSHTFEGALWFDANLSDWVITRVTTMYAMFRAAEHFTGKLCWRPSPSVNTYSMFTGTRSGKLQDDESKCSTMQSYIF